MGPNRKKMLTWVVKFEILFRWFENHLPILYDICRRTNCLPPKSKPHVDG